MFASLQNPLALAGRVLLSLMFVLAGIGKIGGFAGTAGYIASKGLPASELLTGLVILLEIGAGVALALGFLSRWAALALAAFTLIASLIFHAYWSLPADQQMAQQLMFMKNIAIIGGLLFVAAFGPGAWSVDGRRLAT
jgi:putative oxidoreductase